MAWRQGGQGQAQALTRPRGGWIPLRVRQGFGWFQRRHLSPLSGCEGRMPPDTGAHTKGPLGRGVPPGRDPVWYRSVPHTQKPCLQLRPRWYPMPCQYPQHGLVRAQTGAVKIGGSKCPAPAGLIGPHLLQSGAQCSEWIGVGIRGQADQA